MSYNKKCRWFSMEYVGNPGAVPACNQKGTLELFDCASCPENPDNKKRTNADRIQAMTDEKIASFLALIELTHFPQRSITTELEKSYDKWLDWLREEAKT